MRGISLILGTLAVTIFHMGCGESKKSAFLEPVEGGGTLSCADGEFKLRGTIAGQTVQVDYPTANSGGGYSRINPASFDTQYISFAEDPTRTRVSLEWIDDFMKDTFDATGTLLMGTSGVLPGQSFCLGAGTQINFLAESVEFKLKGLSRGSDCSEAVSGSVMGCYY
jgi:hypothetical protein